MYLYSFYGDVQRRMTLFEMKSALVELMLFHFTRLIFLLQIQYLAVLPSFEQFHEKANNDAPYEN